MAKEKIEYINGEKKELEVNRLGFRKANQIAKKHIPIEKLTFHKETNDITIEGGGIDLLGMSESCLETIEGINLDQITSEEANRIYKTYFEKDVMAGMGQGGNPN